MVEMGTGEYTYEVAEGWGTLPDGWSFKEAAAVGVDSNDNVYVFNRGEHPMMVHDGYYVDTWPEALTIPLLTEEQAAAVFAALAEPGETRRIIYQIEALEIRRVPLPDDTKGMLAEFWQHVRDSLSPLPDDDG